LLGPVAGCAREIAVVAVEREATLASVVECHRREALRGDRMTPCAVDATGIAKLSGMWIPVARRTVQGRVAEPGQAIANSRMTVATRHAAVGAGERERSVPMAIDVEAGWREAVLVMAGATVGRVRVAVELAVVRILVARGTLSRRWGSRRSKREDGE
jgi:hypothetical protein